MVLSGTEGVGDCPEEPIGKRSRVSGSTKAANKVSGTLGTANVDAEGMVEAANKMENSQKPFICEEGEGLVKFRLPLGVRRSFQDFVLNCDRNTVLGFFRGISSELEDVRRLVDFHLKVVPTCEGQSFAVEVLYGERAGKAVEDVPAGACISCHAGAPLFPGSGVLAGETVLAEYGLAAGKDLVQCSLDAKARPMFVVTPLRHVERMSELDDDEALAVWCLAGKLLATEKLQFQSMILNHGSYRNLPHLHLKIRIPPRPFEAARQRWTQERLCIWNRLVELQRAMPQKADVCYNFKKGSCRFGSRCRYVHAT